MAKAASTAAVAAFTLFGLVATSTATTAHARELLLHDPNLNVGDLAEFSGVFQRFLETLGPGWKFQAFGQLDALELRLTLSPDDALAVVPSSLLKRREELKLRPLIVPVYQGDPYYRKTLVAASQVPLSSLKGRNVAATVTADKAKVQRQLRRIGLADVFLVAVPKDVDALLALYFGQVDAALVTPGSISVLKRVNPMAVKRFARLAETDRFLRSVLCAVGRSGRDAQELREEMLKLFGGMADVPAGRELMTRMAFDGWVPFRPEMLAE